MQETSSVGDSGNIASAGMLVIRQDVGSSGDLAVQPRV